MIYTLNKITAIYYAIVKIIEFFIRTLLKKNTKKQQIWIWFPVRRAIYLDLDSVNVIKNDAKR